MPAELPKTYKVAIFKEKGQPLEFEDRDLKLPGHGEVNTLVFFLGLIVLVANAAV